MGSDTTLKEFDRLRRGKDGGLQFEVAGAANIAFYV